MKAEKAAVAAAVGGGGDEWRCRKHPAARSGGGVCPYCLRDRLLRLCPNCARVRPCPCTCASPSSSSSASGDAVGRVHSLIEREHRVARSRSVAASSSAAMASVATAASGRRKARVWGWTPFWKSSAKDGCAAPEEDEEEERLGLARSSSVSATAVEAKAVAAKAAATKARWGWHFPSPMKAFRQHRRSSASMPERG
ncbi:uncharacterized protein LOC123402183 [Hordeum vulgare subsp. vulgare]|uniref:Predicted protein n=1 Tax=Hordeum vulgare subsp. vulgare TaxID=112509 RepID=F2D2N7_HORVV|nr:uncharacterized protein LOC123402183 [Hordeum vulgare subsp. vulgare]KAI4981256.1 hypothetical protein ZWY2020_021741 [Hordeum vulgare]BAJ89358.1 predicted protein [Hordeum vulgare subsp. vulgare]